MINIKRLSFIFLFFVCYFTTSVTNAQSINKFNADNKRTGIWKKYYANKRIRYVGTFKNGKEVGVFKFYDITTSDYPVILKTFSETSDTIFVQFFNLKGKLQSKGNLIGKNRTGNWQYLFPNGELMSEENYKNGKLDGELLNYYPAGNVTEYSIYKNGLKDGVLRKYSSKNILIEEVFYKNDKLNGIAKYFELNGNLKEEGSYKDGKRVGKWEYYLDGEIASEETKKQNRASYNKKNN